MKISAILALWTFGSHPARAATLAESCRAKLEAVIASPPTDSSQRYQGYVFHYPKMTRFGSDGGKDRLIKPGDVIVGGSNGGPSGFVEGKVKAVLLVDTAGSYVGAAPTDLIWVGNRVVPTWSLMGNDSELLLPASSDRGLATPKLRVLTHEGRRDERHLPERLPMWLGDFVKLGLVDGRETNGRITGLLLNPSRDENGAPSNFYLLDHRHLVPESAIDPRTSRVMWPGLGNVRLGDWVKIPSSRRKQPAFEGKVQAIERGGGPAALEIGDVTVPLGAMDLDRAKVKQRSYLKEHRQGAPSTWLLGPVLTED